MDELREQTREVLAGRPAQPKVFAEPCAFNLFSHDSAVDVETGQNGEEAKIIAETRKIWSDSEVRVIPTCVRVPVLRAHTQAVTVTFARPATEAQVRETISRGAGLRIVDDRARNKFPTPAKASGGDEVLVGRIRAAEPIEANATTDRFCLLLSGDQLRKGAALNAVQIAECVESRR
jgi:aspartate-semialdehyde dehydrogenase